MSISQYNSGFLFADRQIEKLRRCELITEAEVKTLCAKAREILVEESNVQQVDSPVTVRNFLIGKSVTYFFDKT